MPFTASHAVVAIPFARTPLPAGAVAVGAMAPDLPLFFPGPVAYAQTHGFPDLLVTSLPLALVLYAVWRVLLRPALSGLLPRAIGARVPCAWDVVEAPRRPARAGLLVVAATLIGVATHVVGDLFTHAGRAGSAWIPLLAERWGPLDGTSWLQYASSVLGLAGVAVWGVVALRRARPEPRRDGAAVRVIRLSAYAAAVLSAVGGAIIGVVVLGAPTSYREVATLAFAVGTRVGAVTLIVTLIAAAAVRVVRVRRGAAPAG